METQNADLLELENTVGIVVSTEKSIETNLGPRMSRSTIILFGYFPNSIYLSKGHIRKVRAEPVGSPVKVTWMHSEHVPGFDWHVVDGAPKGADSFLRVGEKHTGDKYIGEGYPYFGARHKTGLYRCFGWQNVQYFAIQEELEDLCVQDYWQAFEGDSFPKTQRERRLVQRAIKTDLRKIK